MYAWPVLFSPVGRAVNTHLSYFKREVFSSGFAFSRARGIFSARCSVVLFAGFASFFLDDNDESSDRLHGKSARSINAR